MLIFCKLLIHGHDNHMHHLWTLYTTAARSVCIKVNEGNASQVLVMAAEKGFDWVHYTSKEYVTLSAAPDDSKYMKGIAYQ